jgi:hypothetical protein
MSEMRRFSPSWALVFALLPTASAFAVDRTWVGTTTDWSLASNWKDPLGVAGVPGNTDRAIIPSAPTGGRFPTIAATPTAISQLLVNAGATLTIITGVRLDINGSVSPFIDGTGTVVTAGTGFIQLIGGVNNGVLVNNSMTLGSLTVNVPANLTYVIAAGRTVTVNGSLTVQVSTLQLGVAGQAAVTLDVNGSISIPANGSLEIRSSGSRIQVSGNWTQTGRWLAGINSTVVFDGAAAQTIDIERATVAQFAFQNLQISNTAALVTYLDNSLAASPNGLNVLGNLTVDSGSRFLVQDFAVIGDAVTDTFGIGSGATVTFQNTFNPSCTISFAIDGGAQDGSLNLQGTNYPPSDGSDFGYALIAGHGNVVLQFTGDGTFPLANGGPYAFWNLIVETGLGGGQVGTNVVTLNAGFTAQNLILRQGQLQIPNVTVTINGKIDSSDPRTSQLDMTGAGTVQVKGDVDLDSYSQVNGGVGGPYATVLMNGTTPQRFQIRSSVPSQFFDLDSFRVSNPMGVTVLDNPNANFVVNGTLTIDAGCSLTIRDTFDADGPIVFGAGGGNVLRLEGDIVGDGTPLGTVFTAGTGTVVYAGNPLSQVVYARSNGTSIPYYNLTIDNGGGALATQEAAGLLTVNGSFTILGATSSFRAGAGNMTVARDFICNGNFDAQSYTVTMAGVGAGSGNIGGTSGSLTFNNLLVNGATTWAVTAARTFSVSNTFQVLQGLLTTAGAAAPITMNALAGFTAGDGAGGAGTAVINLTGGDTLAIATLPVSRTFAVNGTDGLFSANSNANGTPTLTRIGGSGNFITTVDGQVNIRKLNFSFGDFQGLRINNATSASILRLSGISFSGMFVPPPVGGSRYLTINSPGIDLDCPGCIFAAVPAGCFNVWAVATAGTVRIRFEDRGTAPAAGGGGPGAGEAFDGDDDTNDNGIIDGAETTALHGGAIIQWVYSTNIDMGGSVQGFPTPAFDWNLFANYSTYVIARNVAGTTDTIFVLNSEGDLRGPSFSVAGVDIVGPLFWDTEGLTHVVYFGANDPAGTGTGYIYKLVDTGGSLIPAAFPWDTPFSLGGGTEVTSAVVSDQSNIYFGGRSGVTNGIYKVRISDKTMPLAALSTATRRVSTAPSWSDSTTGRSLFLASNAVTNRSNIYRVNVPTWSIDATFTDTTNGSIADDCTTNFVAITNLPLDILYVGEMNGWMHGIAALGANNTFLEAAGYPFRDTPAAPGAVPIQGGAVYDFLTRRLFFGNDAGSLYMLIGYTAPSWSLGTDYYRTTPVAGVPIRTMPLFQSGVLYASNTAGQLFVLDANNGLGGQTLLRTWNMSNTALSDVSRDATTGRIYVGTATGRVLSVPATADPTGTFP